MIQSRIRVTAVIEGVHCIELNPLPGVWIKACIDTTKQIARFEITVLGFSIVKDFDFNDAEVDIPVGPGGVKIRYKDGKVQINAYIVVPIYGRMETGWITLFQF